MIRYKPCPDCGTELTPDAPAGVCPQCLLKAGMSDTASESADATLIKSSVARAHAPADFGAGTSPSAPGIGTRVKYFGDYELLGEIARGGMGVVYKARQVRLNRTVALKMILAGQFAAETDVQRFHTEAEAAAQLDHPGIVPIFEVGEHDGHHYFSMGLVDGESLAAQLADGPLPPKQAAELVRRVAVAVQYAHDKGVVHRDLKPANILIDRDGQPRATDFGLAKRVEGDSNLTGTGQILGTPSYMPPEQAAGRTSEVREAADVYALGAILYTTLTGRPPFQAANPVDTLMQVLEREPISPRTLNPKTPRDLETISLKCLEKDQRQRYPSAQALVDELQRFLDGKPILARPISRPARAWRWCKRNRLVASLLATLMSVFVVGFFAVSLEWLRAEREAERNRKLLFISDLAAEDKAFHYQLSNGLTVLLRPVTGATQTALVVLYSVGNHHDPQGQSGLAHLLSAIYVTASTGETQARSVVEFLQRYGQGWNAQTDDRYTVIATTFSPTAMEAELRDAALRMSELRIDADDLQRVRPSLLQTLSHYQNAGEFMAMSHARELIHPGPEGRRRTGRSEDIARLTVEDVHTWWDRYYKPSNAMIVLAGDVDVPAVRKVIAQHFGPIPSGEPIPEPAPAMKPRLGQTTTLTSSNPQANARTVICLAYAPPAPPDDDFAAFLILAHRLMLRSMGPFGIPSNSQAPTVQFMPLDQSGVLFVNGPARDGETHEAAVARIEEFVSQALSADLKPQEVADTKRRFGFLLGTMRMADFGLLQNLYGTAFRTGRRVQLQVPLELIDKLDLVDNDDLKRAVALYFHPTKRVTVIAQPPGTANSPVKK